MMTAVIDQANKTMIVFGAYPSQMNETAQPAVRDLIASTQPTE